MDLSYQEKSILGSLLAMVVVYGYYFASVLRDAEPSRVRRRKRGPSGVRGGRDRGD